MNKLRRGDKITLTMPYGRFTYRVEGLRVVLPDNMGVLKHVRHNRLVLTTCTPVDSAAKRLVATARLERAVARGPAVTLVPDAARRAALTVETEETASDIRLEVG